MEHINDFEVRMNLSVVQTSNRGPCRLLCEFCSPIGRHSDSESATCQFARTAPLPFWGLHFQSHARRSLYGANIISIALWSRPSPTLKEHVSAEPCGTNWSSSQLLFLKVWQTAFYSTVCRVTTYSELRSCRRTVGCSERCRFFLSSDCELPLYRRH